MQDIGLTENEIQRINSVFTQYPEIKQVVLYGSRAKGNYRKGSDIDLTLLGKNLNLALLNKVSLDLDDLLLPYEIDLSIYAHIDNPKLLEHIKRVGVVFWGS